MAVVGLGVFIAMGGLGGGGGAEAAAPAVVADGPRELGPMVEFESMIIRLSGTNADGQSNYLKVTFQIEARDEEALARITSRMVAVRDGVLTLATAWTAADVEGAENLAQVRARIVEAICRIAGEESARAIYFTEYLVQ